MGLLIPAVFTIAAFAFFSEPKKAQKALPPTEPKPDNSDFLPSNIALIPAGDFAWGVTIELGPSIGKEETEEIMDVIIDRAVEHPQLVFEVALEDDVDGIALFFYEDGIARERWVDGAEALGVELDTQLENFTGP